MTKRVMGVSGTVKDGRTLNPIQASIYIGTLTNFVSSTADTGKFSRMLLPGEYNIRVSAPDFSDEVITVTVKNDAATDISVELLKVMEPISDNTIVLYIVVSVIVICSALIFTVELVYYMRSKRKLVQYFRQFDSNTPLPTTELLF